MKDMNEDDSNKDDNEMQDDQEIDRLLQSDMVAATGSTGRVDLIVKAAKRETGVRDLLTHVLLRVWVPILSIGSIFFVFISKKQALSDHLPETKPITDKPKTRK